MSCPPVQGRVIALDQPRVSPRLSARRERSRASRAPLAHGTPASRLAAALCQDGRSSAGGASASILQIPALLRRADRLASEAAAVTLPAERSQRLEAAMQVYNRAVSAYEAYERGRAPGAPDSLLLENVDWDGPRTRLVETAGFLRFRLEGLSASPRESMVFRLGSEVAPRMSDREVSRAILQLTRLRNRIREVDAVEDDASLPMARRLRAAAQAGRFVRRAVGLIERLRSEAPNPEDLRISRLSREIIRAACDDPAAGFGSHHVDVTAVAGTVRLYQGVARHAILGAPSDGVDVAGTGNHLLSARLQLLRARRAADVMAIAGDAPEAGPGRAELLAEQRILYRQLGSTRRRIVARQSREARRLLVRAGSVLRARRGRELSEARREAALENYRCASRILDYLREVAPTDRRVTRLQRDHRWARLAETFPGSVARA